MKFYKNKKVLITGHTGFQDVCFAQILLGWGADVISVSLLPHMNSNLFSLFGLRKRMKSYFHDIRKLEKIVVVFKNEILNLIAPDSMIESVFSVLAEKRQLSVYDPQEVIDKVIKQIGK